MQIFFITALLVLLLVFTTLFPDPIRKVKPSNQEMYLVGRSCYLAYPIESSKSYKIYSTAIDNISLQVVIFRDHDLETWKLSEQRKREGFTASLTKIHAYGNPNLWRVTLP